MRYVIVSTFALMLLASLVLAGSGGAAFDNLTNELNNLIGSLRGLVGPLGALMLVAAGVVYAGGQMMGAEMRSRSISWAHALAVGGIIGIVLAFSACGIAKFVMEIAGGDSTSLTC